MANTIGNWIQRLTNTLISDTHRNTLVTAQPRFYIGRDTTALLVDIQSEAIKEGVNRGLMLAANGQFGALSKAWEHSRANTIPRTTHYVSPTKEDIEQSRRHHADMEALRQRAYEAEASKRYATVPMSLSNWTTINVQRYSDNLFDELETRLRAILRSQKPRVIFRNRRYIVDINGHYYGRYLQPKGALRWVADYRDAQAQGLDQLEAASRATQRQAQRGQLQE